MKKSGVVLVLLLSMIPPLSAQSNELLDSLLDQDQALYGDVVRLALNAAGLVPETATAEQALETLKQQGWQAPILAADAPTPLGDYAFILMKAFDVSGGIMYRLYPGPRYACRELGYIKAIPSDARPNRIVSGQEVIEILGNVMALKGGS